MPSKSDEPDDRYIVPALDRGLLLLQQFTKENPQLNLATLAKRLNLQRGTVYRLIYTLERRGFLEKVADSKNYRPGPKVLSLGFELLHSNDLMELARPHLERLRDLTNANTHLGIRDGVDVVYLVRVPANTSLVSNIQVGSRLPIHANPMGHVLLTDLSEQEIKVLFRNRKLEVFSDRTPSTVKELQEAVERAKANGFVIGRSTVTPDVASVAAPVFNALGRVAAAINVVGPQPMMEKAGLETTIKAAALSAAAAISAANGFRAAVRPGQDAAHARGRKA